MKQTLIEAKTRISTSIDEYQSSNGRVVITADPLDIRQVEDSVTNVSCGGIVTFTGRVRNIHDGQEVIALEYEAYTEMAARVIEDLIARAEKVWPTVALAVHHRLGPLKLGDIAVVVVAASVHRTPAFEANQWLIRTLKDEVPIFKRETRANGTIWVGQGP